MRGTLRNFVAAFATLICAFVSQAYADGKRVALVIGNGAYQSVAALPNPRNDAALISQALRKQGFEVVTAFDLSRVELERTVERYARALNGAEISLFYYSGHGIEVGGENRLIPIDATLAAPEDLETQTFSLQTIMLYMQRNSKAQLIYLDACRNNPFSDRKFLVGLDGTETKAGKGLAEYKGGIGSLIAYAASPGQEALDGDTANSPFTTAVMRHVFTQGLDVQSALMKVTEDVWIATNQLQRPWVNSTLVKPVFLNGPFVNTVSNLPPLKLDPASPSRNVATGPYILGAGAQPVFDDRQFAELPQAEAYTLLHLPQSGSLFVDGEVVAEGMVFEAARFKTLRYEPSAVEVAPNAALTVAAVQKNGLALPATLQLPLKFDDCDLLAAEPLDLQGMGSGVELSRINPAQAVAACTKAISAHGDIPRFTYQLGRAQLAAGNSEQAVALFQRAADVGHIRAIFALGDLTLRGVGLPKNAEAANTLFKRAADRGDALALFALGRNMVKGIGAKANAQEGVALLKRAAEMGHTDALEEIASLYLYGLNGKASPKRAAKFLEASVSRSLAKDKRRRSPALIERPTMPTDLGAAYFNGRGVARDLRQAIKWYEFGAERGNQGGVADLSWIFAEGPDDLRDPMRAVWFTSLALGTPGLRGDADLRRRLADLPDEAKRDAMRNFIDLVGPCATSTTDTLDDTLQLLSAKTWLFRQSEEQDLTLLDDDGSFSAPEGPTAADELRYWNLVNNDNRDQAYLAYLRHFPDGMFSAIAKGRLGGLLERARAEPEEAVCEKPAVQPMVKQPARKIAPQKQVEPTRKITKPKPAPAPLVLKQKPRPKPVAEKPKRKPNPPVKRPRTPPVVIHHEEEGEPELEEAEPEFEAPPIKLRLRKFRKRRPPLEQMPPDEFKCDGLC